MRNKAIIAVVIAIGVTALAALWGSARTWVYEDGSWSIYGRKPKQDNKCVLIITEPQQDGKTYARRIPGCKCAKSGTMWCTKYDLMTHGELKSLGWQP